MDPATEPTAGAANGRASGGMSSVEQVFSGNGEMARLMRAMDWAATPLGPVETWPPSLRMMVRVLLQNRFPLLLWWGPDFVQLYNDAYRPVLGAKHPQYLGRPTRECWSEIWDVIGPLIETPFSGGPATWSEDILLEINRYGFVEETHFTIAYSPVPDETCANGIGGVLATVHEISEKVVAERRVSALRDLGARSAEAKSAEEACELAAATLALYPRDIPFAALYLIDPDGAQARLGATAGIERTSPLAPPLIALRAPRGAAADDGHAVPPVWPLAEGVHRETLQVVDDLASRFATVPAGPWSDPPSRAVVVPIRSNRAHQLAGLLVAGVSARLRLDDGYAGFYDLVGSQVATAIANARAYEEERRRAEALAELDRAKTAFFSNVSHEFRTPLTLLLGPLEDSLADAGEPPSPRQRERLEVMRRNGLRLLKLVNTLLDFARIEAGRVQASYEPVDLAAYTAELASAFRSLVEKAGLAFVVECPPLTDLAAPVYVDREMWEKVVFNLLSNAFKYTLAGSITVALRSLPAADGSGAAGAVELTVRDTGVGIAPAELPRLFERFHRVEGTQARTHEGSGIGLALVQELVHLHGGTIRAESGLGEGTTFFVRLPVGAAHLPADRISAPATLASTALGAAPYLEEAERWLPAGAVRNDEASVAPWLADASERPRTVSTDRSARIVLADDNADMRDYLLRLLGERYMVVSVANGAEALAAVRAQPPDLILSDVMMPELDGFGLLSALRADPRTAAIPFILVSARAGEEATIEGLQAGADDYLVKPFSAREVLSRVAARLEIARARREAEARAREMEITFDAMADGIAVYDRDGHIVTCNAAWREMAARVIGEDNVNGTLAERAAYTRVLDADGRPLAQAEWPQNRILAGETLTGALATDIAFDVPGGERVYFSLSGAPLRGGDGRLTGGVIITRDVTDRRRLERRTRGALDAVLDLAATMVGDPIEDTDRSQELALDAAQRADETLNRFATLCSRVLGCERVAVVVIEPRTELLRAIAVAGSAREQEQRFRGGFSDLRLADRFGAEVAACLRAGETAVIHVENLPARDPARLLSRRLFLIAPMLAAGALYGYIGVNFGDEECDYTPENRALALAVAQLAALVIERERLLRQREESRARVLALQDANARMDEFLGIASHELRTPLTSITANVQLANRQLARLRPAGPAADLSTEDGVRTHMDRIGHLLQRTDRQAGRLDRLVGDLLDVSRIQAGKLELRREPCDLLAIVREAVQEQRAVWPRRGIALQLPQRSTIALHADADRIGQVVTNYLTNALKYSGMNQSVVVRVRLQEAEVRVEVSDQGPGLTPEQQRQLFERFYRVPGIAQQSGSGVGLGLGLHICRTIVERHGGQVGCTSSPGAGSTFWFTLPLAAPESVPDST